MGNATQNRAGGKKSVGLFRPRHTFVVWCLV